MEVDEQRERVLAEAEALFYGRGIQSVGMDLIRTSSGVSLKRIYQMFPSKDDLVAAVLARRDRRWTDGLHEHVEVATGSVEKILAVFDWLDEWFRQPDFRGCSFINSFGELGSTSTTVANAARANKSTYRREIGQLVAAGGFPDELATYVALLTEGAITTAAIAGTPEPAAQARAAASLLITFYEASVTVL